VENCSVVENDAQMKRNPKRRNIDQIQKKEKSQLNCCSAAIDMGHARGALPSFGPLNHQTKANRQRRVAKKSAGG
jgi:hypothetical protein